MFTTQHVKWLSVLSTVLFSLSCNNAAKESAPPRTTPLTISNTFPVNNATNIPYNAKITVLFNDEIDEKSFNPDNVKLRLAADNTPVTITLEYRQGVGIINPQALLPNTVYIVVIAKGIKDSAGRGLSGQYEWTFTTGDLTDDTPPAITLHVPNDTGAPLNPDIIINFNEAVNINTVSLIVDKEEIIANGTAKKGSMAFSQNVLSINLGLLSPNKSYTVTLRNTLTDLVGNKIEQEFSWTFTTGSAPDNSAPTITSVTPASGSTDLLRDSRFNVKLSEPLNSATVNTGSVFLSLGDTLVDTRVSYYAGDNSITVYPGAYLQFGKLYSLTFGAITDTAGNALNNPPLTFTIEPDTDTDGMPDRWEKLYSGLNPAVKDAVADMEDNGTGVEPGDGLKNLGEFEHNSNPTIADTDGDGLNDGPEVDARRNPTVNEPALITIVNSLLLE